MQLRLGALRQRERSALLGQLDRPPLGGSPLPAASGAAQLRAEVGQRVSQLQTGSVRFKDRDRFLEQCQSLLSTDREPGGAQ